LNGEGEWEGGVRVEDLAAVHSFFALLRKEGIEVVVQR